MGKSVVLLGCGDVGPIHEPMAQYRELVRDRLAEADIRFAQVERFIPSAANCSRMAGPMGGCRRIWPR
jgi:hypothetical protein